MNLCYSDWYCGISSCSGPFHFLEILMINIFEVTLEFYHQPNSKSLDLKTWDFGFGLYLAWQHFNWLLWSELVANGYYVLGRKMIIIKMKKTIAIIYNFSNCFPPWIENPGGQVQDGRSIVPLSQGEWARSASDPSEQVQTLDWNDNDNKISLGFTWGKRQK